MKVKRAYFCNMTAPDSLSKVALGESDVERIPSEQVVFCDFDGPIVDVSERYYQTYQRGLQAIADICKEEHGVTLSITPLTKDQFWLSKQNRVADSEIALRSGVPATWFELYMQQVERIVNHASLLHWDRVQPAAEAALMHFKQANMRLVLVTLRQPRQVNAFLQDQGLTHLVDEVYGASSESAAYRNRVEQKRELLTEAMRQQESKGYSTSQSWMVGDTEADVLAAKEVGLPSAALSCGVRSADYLRSLDPTEVYSELLTAAQAVVGTTGWQTA